MSPRLLIYSFERLSSNDIDTIIPFYIEYYNKIKGCSWNENSARRRLEETIIRNDAYGVKILIEGKFAGFLSGQFLQYDKGVAFMINEVFIATSYQDNGYGKLLLKRVEKDIKSLGATVAFILNNKDEQLNNFFSKMNGYSIPEELVVKTKIL